MLALALRRLGHDVQFIVDQSDKLDRPEYRYPEISLPYPDWIHDVSRVRFRHYAWPNLRRRNIVKILRSCDAVVLNQFGPTLLPLIGRPALVLLTGSDLLFYASHAEQRIWQEGLLHKLTLHALVARQRRGIRMSNATSYFWKGINPEGDALLDDLGIGDDRRFFLLMTDVDRIQPTPLPFNSLPRIFCVARFVWKKPIRPGFTRQDYKGSDVMILGLGLFHRKTLMPLDIHLVRKGVDLDDIVKLVESEGLTRMVTWHDEMSQYEVLNQYRLADIVFDQMGEDSFVGMGGLDAMAMARPLIANGRPEYMSLSSDEPSPICQAATPEEVCNQLERLTASREERQRVADAGRKYVQQFFSSDHSAQVCLDLFGRFV